MLLVIFGLVGIEYVSMALDDPFWDETNDVGHFWSTRIFTFKFIELMALLHSQDFCACVSLCFGCVGE